MLQVNLEEAKDRLLELVDAVLKGETVWIVKDLQETVQLVPVDTPEVGQLLAVAQH